MDGEKVKRHGPLWFGVRDVRTEGREGGGSKGCFRAWGGGKVGGAGQDRARGGGAVSAALPDFDCLIDTARHHVGSSLVEICNRGKHLFRDAEDKLWLMGDVFFKSHSSPRLTQRGNEVFVGTQRLHAAFVLVVPDPKGFIVGTAHYESPSGVNQHAAHPVVVSHLKRAGV